ncbi:glycosyltransferase [Methylobacterium oryzae]
MHPVSIVIPTLNEAEAIGAVIREIPPAYAGDIIVADSGSTDGTQDIARAAGARVIEAGRGYGRACALGAAAAAP